MNVKNAPPLETLRALLRDRNGLISTADLARRGIPRVYLTLMEKNGEIERVDRGLYAAPGSLIDEMAGLQIRYKTAIFSHETALFLWNLSDRAPLYYAITVPSGYNATNLKESGAKTYFVRRNLLDLGEITLPSPHGNPIQTYNLERTICDTLRSRNQMDIQVVSSALKSYAGLPEKNIPRLYQYAQQFSLQKVVRQYLEVLL